MSNNKPDLDELKLAPEIIDLSKKIEKEISFNEAGVASLGKDFYESTLPEGLTTDMVSKIQKHHQNLASATGLALTNTAVPYMKKHKDINTVELVMPVLKDKLEGSFDRSKTYPARGEGAEPLTKYGVLNMNFTVNGAVNQRGTLKKIRGYANEFAASQLS